MSTTRASRLPTFLIVGAQKAATRWLRDNLAAHPDVSVHRRELEFFTHNYDRGLEWYRETLDAPPGVTAVGEGTPGYLMWVNRPDIVAARIDGALPDVRLVALLRDPVERAVSAYVHHSRMGRLDDAPPLADLLATIDPETDRLGLISGGWYGRSLAPYVRRFGERLLVLLHEDVRSAPTALYRRVCEHIGVDRSTEPSGITQVRHSNREHVPTDVLERAALTEAQRSEIWERWFEDDVILLEQHLAAEFGSWRDRNGAPSGGPGGD
jgi:hypothetical protein